MVKMGGVRIRSILCVIIMMGDVGMINMGDVMSKVTWPVNADLIKNMKDYAHEFV